MTAVNPFDYTADKSNCRISELLGPVWADRNTPMTRLVVGKPAVDDLLARTETNSYTRAVDQVATGGGLMLAGTNAQVSDAISGAMQDAFRPLAADYFSAYKQANIPDSLLHGVKVAAGVGQWANQVTSLRKLAPSVSAHPWTLSPHKSVLDAMSGLHTGAGNGVWEAMMGKQIISATAPLESVMRAVRNVVSLTQGSGMKALIDATRSPIFAAERGDGFKVKLASMPLSKLGPAATDYAAAARRISESLGMEDVVQDDAEFVPTANDTAYEMLARLAPDVAAQVDAEAASVKTSFWQRRAVRNSLAWTAWGLFHLMIIFVMVILPGCGLVSPWGASSGAYALSRLEAQGLSPKMVKDKIAFSKKDSDED